MNDTTALKHFFSFQQIASEINPSIFRERYAYTGRPLLVRNATNWWPAVEAFTFNFFRDLYEDLNRLVQLSECNNDQGKVYILFR